MPQMMALILKEAKSMGFSQEAVNQIQLAAEEALVNVIHYAYPDKDGEVKITVNPQQGKQLEVVITDQGVAFDPLSLPEPDLETPLESRKIGGLGVYLMRKLMDEVRYKREGGRNILSFMKKL